MSFSSYLKIGTYAGGATGVVGFAYMLGQSERNERHAKNVAPENNFFAVFMFTSMGICSLIAGSTFLVAGPILGASTGACLYGSNKTFQYLRSLPIPKPIKHLGFAITATSVASLSAYSFSKGNENRS